MFLRKKKNKHSAIIIHMKGVFFYAKIHKNTNNLNGPHNHHRT